MSAEDAPHDLRPATRLVHLGRRRALAGGIVNPPVYRASTVLFESTAHQRQATRDRDQPDTLYYARRGTPTQWALAEAMTALEAPHAAGTFLYPSGAAAVAGALLALLAPGDELLMVDNAYEPTRALCDGVLRRMGIATRYYDPLIGGGIAELIGPATRAVFLESPGSLSFEVQDVPAIAAAARARGVPTLIDNTWATSLLFPALAHGVDVAITACTKYIVGHSDAMLGAVTANAAAWPRIRAAGHQLGQCASPDDAFLGSRGLRTLAVRLRAHGENGLAVARWLSEQPQVARVLHPALPSCPGHAHFVRDYGGASGLFAFEFAAGVDDPARTRFIDALRLFGIGFSWGGFESLALAVDPRPVRSVADWRARGPLVRLHIGLEDPADLIADLGAALAHVAP